MTTKEKNAMIRNMYRIIEEDGITSHIYRDGDWRKVYELRDIDRLQQEDGVQVTWWMRNRLSCLKTLKHATLASVTTCQ